MRAQTIIHKLFFHAIHNRRLNILGQAVETALCTKKLMLTHMARNLVNDKTQERSRIRKVDRLLANKHLIDDKSMIYQKITSWLIGVNKQPYIIIDWSKYPGTEYHILRAAVVRSGRALTVYEELHMKAQENHPDTHNAFLEKLASILPKDCRPIILLDAGFSVPILKTIIRLKYEYVVRVRGLKTFQKKDNDYYEPIKSLMTSVTNKIQNIGEVTLTKKNPWTCQLFVFKQEPKQRIALTRGRQRTLKKKRVDKMSTGYANSWKEPWVLATSLIGEDAGKKAVLLYMKRMTIEEAFRDLKSHQYGFALSTSRTTKMNRCEVLLLLSMLTTFIAWCLGNFAEKKGWHKQFQANSIYKRRVLSLVSLGCAVVRQRLFIPWRSIIYTLKQASMPTNLSTYEVDYAS